MVTIEFMNFCCVCRSYYTADPQKAEIHGVPKLAKQLVTLLRTKYRSFLVYRTY